MVHLKIGPSMYTTELAERVMGPAVWLNNHALLDEIERMHEQQSIMAEEIEDLRSSLKKTVEEVVIKHKKSKD
ncbi:hypothetical protein HID58_086337, partial [Brassica napus]